MAAIELRNEVEQLRYIASLDGQDVGYVSYEDRGDGVLDLQHTVVADAFEGQGVGGELVRAVLDDARSRGVRIVPTCPFVASYLTRHPDYAELVAD